MMNKKNISFFLQSSYSKNFPHHQITRTNSAYLLQQHFIGLNRLMQIKMKKFALIFTLLFIQFCFLIIYSIVDIPANVETKLLGQDRINLMTFAWAGIFLAILIAHLSIYFKIWFAIKNLDSTRALALHHLKSISLRANRWILISNTVGAISIFCLMAIFMKVNHLDFATIFKWYPLAGLLVAATSIWIFYLLDILIYRDGADKFETKSKLYVKLLKKNTIFKKQQLLYQILFLLYREINVRKLKWNKSKNLETNYIYDHEAFFYLREILKVCHKRLLPNSYFFKKINYFSIRALVLRNFRIFNNRNFMDNFLTEFQKSSKIVFTNKDIDNIILELQNDNEYEQYYEKLVKMNTRDFRRPLPNLELKKVSAAAYIWAQTQFCDQFTEFLDQFIINHRHNRIKNDYNDILGDLNHALQLMVAQK